jgi:hypothetical protein
MAASACGSVLKISPVVMVSIGADISTSFLHEMDVIHKSTQMKMIGLLICWKCIPGD